jgi:hypothetical protein
MRVMPEFETSEMVSVCVPTVPSVTLNEAVPFESEPETGVFAAPSLDVSRMASALETGFQ